MERVRPLDKSRWQDHLDFICPKCGLLVRVVYEPGNSYAMGCYEYEIVDVVEMLANKGL
jgi:acetone carboxylase gamma subunit